MTASIKIRRPDDFHVHLRQNDMLGTVIRFTAGPFARALVMPNLKPRPVLTADDVSRYRTEIAGAVRDSGCVAFEPLMTIQITEETTPEIIVEAHAAGAIAGKVYPRGVTTNSNNGVTMEGFGQLSSVWEAMAECGLVLCLHGEHAGPEVFCLDREEAFLETLSRLAKTFPNLRIVLEHVTTEAAVNCVNSLSQNVAASITVHHLELTLDNIIGGSLDPHAFCKPVAKRPSDRHALLLAATGGNTKFFFGSDSAPHTRVAKHGDGCAGIFSAPVALEVLAEVFQSCGALQHLEAFVSVHGARHYRLPLNEGFIELKEAECLVPAMYGNIVPYRANQTLRWRRVHPV